jgi:hypothetical protein
MLASVLTLITYWLKVLVLGNSMLSVVFLRLYLAKHCTVTLHVIEVFSAYSRVYWELRVFFRCDWEQENLHRKYFSLKARRMRWAEHGA